MALKLPFANDALTYGFEWLRTMLEASLQEGVLNVGGAGTDFKVTAAAAGLLRVDIAAGGALIKGDSGTPGTGLTQGMYLAINDASVANALTFATADATNPRIDQVGLYVNDSSDLGSSSDTLAFGIVQGTATAGATLDNRTGAAALPSNFLRLADVLIPAASTVVLAANVRDRRPWARGARFQGYRAANYTLTASSVAFDSTNLSSRLELSGAPLNIKFQTWTLVPASASAYTGFMIDGVNIGNFAVLTGATGGMEGPVGFDYPYSPTAGSRVVAIHAKYGGPSIPTLYGGMTWCYFEEVLRGAANN